MAFWVEIANRFKKGEGKMLIDENQTLLRDWFDPTEGWESLNQRIHGAEDPKAKIQEFYKKARLETFTPDFTLR